VNLSDINQGCTEKGIQRRHGGATHQWIPRFPPKLPTQKLNHSLKVIRNGHSKEVLLHYRRVSHRLEAHDDYREKEKRTARSTRRYACHGSVVQSASRRKDGRIAMMPCYMCASEPFVGSFFLQDSRAARPSARPASTAGSWADSEGDKWMASGVIVPRCGAGAALRYKRASVLSGNCRPANDLLALSRTYSLSSRDVNVRDAYMARPVTSPSWVNSLQISCRLW